MELKDLQSRLATDGSLTLAIRCHPRAKRAAIGSILADGSVKASVRAAAEDGRANEELLALLETTFPGASAMLVSGQTSRQKTVRLSLR